MLPPTERFPLQLPMALQVPSVTFAAPAMTPPLTACVLPSVPKLLVSFQAAQVHPVTYRLTQTRFWHGVLGTLEQLPHGVQVSQGVQLPQGMQLPHVPAPCPPSYGGGQQVITGMLVPHQPVGLGWWPRCSPCNPTDSCQLSVPARPGPPPPHGHTAQRCRALLCSIPCSAAPRIH